ncbi:MAG: hypothetical protein J1F63_01385 [Oscillospiraceae bacterium]|nr:hypothetical protein [Oscillospiraceae bacterium]
MGFFSKLASAVRSTAKTVTKVAQKTVEVASTALSYAASKAVDWAIDKLGGSSYNSGSIESRKGVEQALADFRSEISEQAKEAEEASIYSAMSRFDEFADTLEESFPELVELVRKRQSETESMLANTIINYAQEHISENDPVFERLLKMEPGSEKKSRMSKYMQDILEDAQEHFGLQLKRQINMLNEELNIRLEQKIVMQEQQLKNTEERYRRLSEQQSSGELDIRKIEEECVPIMEAAACIQFILEQEDHDEHMVGTRSGRSKGNRKADRAN